MSVSKKKIRIIDDDIIFTNILQDKLNECTSIQFSIMTATNGEAGLALVKKEKPDLVLLDLRMPKMDGFEVLESIRKKKEISKTPVLIVTQLSDAEKIAQGTQMGIKGYIVKADVNLDAIVDQVLNALE
jgi:DNA-binding response OmpR family regulator